MVADTKYSSLRSEAPPTFYDPYQQRGLARSFHVALRFDGPAGSLEPAIREAVASVDRAMPVIGLRTQAEQIATATSRERIFSRLLSLFGVFALLVACIGLHGVTAFSVARRRGEIGVRLAIGSSPGQVLWLVLRQVLLLAGIGVAIGLGTAYLLGPVVASMLYGLAPTDPAVLIGTAAVLGAVAILAGWLPARRAARTDAVAELTRSG